ncbi:MAG: site-specific integrase [Alphaproteobacteria bacterium]
MKPIDANAALAATLPANAVTLAEAIERIMADAELAATRRRDLASALRTIARALGRPPQILPASVHWLRPRLERLHHEQLGLSAKRLRNVVSDATAALRHLGLAQQVARDNVKPLSPQWMSMAAAVRDVPALHRGLSRFIGFCARLGIQPNDVSDETVAAYHTALDEGLLLKRPRPLVQLVVLRWNEAAATIPGWPTRRLGRLDARDTYCLNWDAFPASFQADVDRWLHRLSGHDLLANDAPDKPLSPATLKHRRHQIRALASASCHAGLSVDQLVDLGVLVEPATLRLGLGWLLSRNGNRSSGAIHGVATAAKALARHHVGVEEDTLEQIRDICRKLDPGSIGLTEKNRTRLRQFDDSRNVALLLELPDRLMREAQTRPSSPRSALKAQTAVAIALLLMAPIRLRNLAAIDLDRHICRDRGAETFLVIDRVEVKNRQDIEIPLAAQTVALLDSYVSHFISVLAPGPTNWLFPRRHGDGHKAPGHLGDQIKREVFRLTGLEVHVHLFRHIAAKLYLDANPGGYEVVRRLLGHSSMDTTVRAYTGLEGAAAARHFDAVIEDVRQRVAPARRGKVRRRTARRQP